MSFQMLIILVAGFFGGFLGGQVGSGAIITLPALLFLGLEPSFAIGTNILSGWLINVAAVVKYWRSRKIDFHLVIPFSFISFVGALIGSNLVLAIDKTVLGKIVAFFFLALIFVLFKKPKAGLVVEKLNPKALAAAYILALLLGIYGGFFSVGVATLFIFLYVLLLGKDLLLAAANSTFVTAVMLIGALVIFVVKKNIDYSLAIPLAITSIIGSYIGAHTALKFGDKWLKLLITIVVIALVIKLFLGR